MEPDNHDLAPERRGDDPSRGGDASGVAHEGSGATHEASATGRGARSEEAALDALRRAYTQLSEREDPPAPWKGSGEAPWADASFSADYARAATRDADTTKAEIQHIVSVTQLPLDPSPRQAWSILDLGCGDGRLLLPLVRMGHRGFGFDLGPVPVEKLQEEAQRLDLPIESMVADLRDWARGRVALQGADAFDLILLSFGTLGAVDRASAHDLLTRATSFLRPGGWLHLDMGLSVGFAEELDGRQEWWTSDDFVTGRGRQLILDDHSFDEHERVYVRRSFALRMEDPVRLSEVRQTSQLYENDELEEMLSSLGMEVEQESGDFFFTPYDRQFSENLVVTARKKP